MPGASKHQRQPCRPSQRSCGRAALPAPRSVLYLLSPRTTIYVVPAGMQLCTVGQCQPRQRAHWRVSLVCDCVTDYTGSHPPGVAAVWIRVSVGLSTRRGQAANWPECCVHARPPLRVHDASDAWWQATRLPTIDLEQQPHDHAHAHGHMTMLAAATPNLGDKTPTPSAKRIGREVGLSDNAHPGNRTPWRRGCGATGRGAGAAAAVAG